MLKRKHNTRRAVHESRRVACRRFLNETRKGSRYARKHRLNESSLSDLQMTVDEFADLDYGKRRELIDQFCKETGFEYVAILDSSDFVDENGDLDENSFAEYESDEMADAVIALSVQMQDEFADGPDRETVDALYCAIADLDIPYDGTQNYIRVYDVTGETWPKPPKGIRSSN